MPKPHRARKALHTTTFLGVSVKVPTQNRKMCHTHSRNFPHTIQGLGRARVGVKVLVELCFHVPWGGGGAGPVEHPFVVTNSSLLNACNMCPVVRAAR